MESSPSPCFAANFKSHPSLSYRVPIRGSTHYVCCSNHAALICQRVSCFANGVGKSSLLCRYVDNTYSGTHVTTIGVDFVTCTIEMDQIRIKLQIWDTAGQERFKTVTSSYYRGTHGILVVYDVSSGESFASVDKWLDDVKENCDPTVSRILVGNKQDVTGTKEVHTEEAQRFADQRHIQLLETSAKENQNVEQVFLALTKTMLDTIQEQAATQARRESDILSNESRRSKKKKTCCCF